MAATYIKNEQAFDALLRDESGPIVVDCTANWCGPCKIVSPLIDQLADAYQGRAKVMKLDLDENRAIAQRFKISSIPAVMYFKQGELAAALIGVKPYEDFSAALDRLL